MYRTTPCSPTAFRSAKPQPCATWQRVTRTCALLLLLSVACTKATVAENGENKGPPDAQPVKPGGGPRLISVGPRLLSNQTSQPLIITGDQLTAGLTLQLGSPLNLELPLLVLDSRHAWSRLPADLPLGTQSEQAIEVRLAGPGSEASNTQVVRLINDTTFPDLTALALSVDRQHAFVLSGTTDTVFDVSLASHEVTALKVGDGPSALATWKDALVVVHQFSPELWVLKGAAPPIKLPAPANASGVLVVGDLAYVAEQARDTVSALDLSQGGRVKWVSPVAPNPRSLLMTAAGLLVGSTQTGELELLDPATGAVLGPRAIEPGPGTSIIGGGTARYGQYVMNGKAVRALAWSPALKRTFVSSIGPNIGPNPDKMEVSMNGGVGVVDLARGWSRHLGFGGGLTEGLALDDAKGLLYAADIGVGVVRVLDAKKLVASDALAAKALLQEVALPPPASFPLVRPAPDFGVKGRAGMALHSGPKALGLSADGKTLWVLNRFTGTLARLDVSRAAEGKAEWKEQLAVTDLLAQRTRRLGQVLYFADLGRTAMSCDACHPEGHGEGVLFEKTTPLRIYRSTTVRGSRETPPYFTPASTHSMGETAKVVGGRNRFHNPNPLPEEIEALTIYASTIPTLPNPFVGADGAPVETLRLPDGQEGHPRRGLALFEGKAACAECHPAPHYTTDQDPATRGRFIDVGTPHFMPLREQWQDTRFEGFGTPALVGAWDTFPMLTTGLAGLAVEEGRVRVKDRFCLRTAVEAWAPKHGRADLLSADEKNDLLAFVMSL